MACCLEQSHSRTGHGMGGVSFLQARSIVDAHVEVSTPVSDRRISGMEITRRCGDAKRRGHFAPTPSDGRRPLQPTSHGTWARNDETTTNDTAAGMLISVSSALQHSSVPSCVRRASSVREVRAAATRPAPARCSASGDDEARAKSTMLQQSIIPEICLETT